jgi:hypothetical protein
MASAGILTIGFLVVWFFISLIMQILGLTPEQRARSQAKREARDAERRRRANERAAQRQQEQWFEEVKRQRWKGTADFASEAEARAALNSKGGRKSNLDERWFS